MMDERRATKVVSSLVFHQVPMIEKEAALAAMYNALGRRGELHVADYGLQAHPFNAGSLQRYNSES
jgi:hypothetical protein